MQPVVILCRFDTIESIADWVSIDDVVMGGISHSHLRYDSMGHAVFEGAVSLEHNGGFASVRSGPLALPLDRAIHYFLEVRGDGKRYKFTLRTDDLSYGIHYQAEFDVPVGAWTSVCLPTSAFIPTFRGRCLPSAPPLESAKLIRQIGFVIADQQAGPFALEVRSVRME